jgi:RsiW-degrading membrane proteinase PrsW (M82 family)
LDVLSQPVIISLFLFYLGILVPVIEEIIKAIGLLPLLHRSISEAEGFLGGLLAGAGYGLFEAFYLGQPGPGWTALMVARAGATMMHMFTAGLTGLGFARAKREGHIKPFLQNLMIAIGLHALWNFAAVLMGIGMLSDLTEQVSIDPTIGLVLSISGALVLIGLSLLAFQRLRRLPSSLQGIELETDA